MKTQLFVAGMVLVAVNAAAYVPAASSVAHYAPAASLAIGVWVIARSFRHSVPALVADADAVSDAPSASPEPMAPEPVKNQADAEVVTLLGAFQEKGRLVDFLMDDITAYSDAQVGGAARVVHQGCQAVLKEHFEIEPVASEKEGGQVTVPAGQAGFYRLSGKVAGEPPFSGKLVHKGWQASAVKLPRVIQPDADQLPPIAPAQVEVG